MTEFFFGVASGRRNTGQSFLLLDVLLLQLALYKFGLEFTMFTIHYPTQDSWYLLDPCGEIEENIGDNEDHDDDEDDTKMEENIIALITEN